VGKPSATKKRAAFTAEDAELMDPQLLEACADDVWTAIRTFYKVSNKDGKLVPVDIPEIIRQHWEASGEISLWLKGRQQFLTTSADAILFQEMVDGEGINVWGLNLTEDKATENHKRVQDFDLYRHPFLKEMTHSVRNSDEIGYNETRGSYKSVTIKNDMTSSAADMVARTATCRRARWTEAAFSRHYSTVKRALLDTMPRSNRKLVIETTGNGAQGGFWVDFMQVVNHGTPHPTLPNCWVMGNVTAHFLPWFRHHEYLRAEKPFQLKNLPIEVQRTLKDNDKEHVQAMYASGLSEEQIEERVNWMHLVLLEEKNLLTDAQGAVRNFNREYPATVDHAFQATGESWFSVDRSAAMRAFWKKENETRRLPIYCNLEPDEQGVLQVLPGQDFMIFEMPQKTHENRYVGILDPSGGSRDGDPAAGGILDRFLMKWVAVFHGPYTPRTGAEMLAKLGRFYNLAYLNWENDSLGIGVTEALLELKYPNLHKNDPKGVDVSSYGWNTGPESRKEMLGEAKTYFDHPYTPINMPYLEFYTEAAAFQKPPGKPHAKPEAVGGAHDDLVMMYAIGTITHCKLMPPLIPLARTRQARPGEASIQQLAKVAPTGTGGAYREAKRRRQGMRNF
jgi:hypothetical protein